ncbi:MAG: SurA N-terminal domain-containing protein [Pedobacter sp.]|nr:SurA N-terminal domain-containing protein [Pedobacter sp.]
MRTRMGYFLVGGIAVVLALFVLEPLLQQGSAFMGASNVVGTIEGEDVKYEDFNAKYDQTVNQYRSQYGVSNPQIQAMALDQAWNAEIAEHLLTKEYARLGIIVSSTELYDLVNGANPSPLILQSFTNQQTGQFDKNALLASLNARKTNPQLKQQWILLEDQIEKQVLQSKYDRLIRSSIYVTSLEANDDYTNRNKLANFSYVNLDYSSILDGGVKLTDADYQAYYDAHKGAFVNPTETRSLAYVSFSIKPTAADTAVIKAQVDKLAADFRTTPNDSLFAANNSDVKIPFVYLGKGKLDPAVDSVIFNLPAGSFYGPTLSGNSYKLIKVVSSRMSPDSVKASHILINPTTVGGEAQAFKLADSLKKLVQGGGNFAELAKKYSVDGSKDNGGDLGTFDRYANMVPEFLNAAFEGSTGDIKVVKTQFGVHVIKIDKQIGSSKVSKLAYIEKSLAPSSKTRDMAYKKAIAFKDEADSKNFEDLAKKKGYTVGVADNIKPTQGFAPGLDDPRALIRAAYKGDKDDVLPEVYKMTDAFVVAKLTAVKPKGQLSLEDVKKQIQPMVLNAAKAKILTAKFDKAGAGSLEQVAQKVGKAVAPVQNIVFANPIIPGLAQENKVVGAIFGSQVGKVSKPIEGDRGVYVIRVDAFTNPAPMPNTFKQKETMLMGITQRAFGLAFSALQDKSDIKDNRVNFY